MSTGRIRWVRTALANCLVVYALGSAIAMPARADWTSVSKQAEALVLSGGAADAEQLFQRALEIAPSDSARGEIYETWGRATLQSADISKDPNETLLQAIRLLKKAAALLPASQRTASQANVGSAYLRLKDYGNAYKVLAPLESSVLNRFDGPTKARYLYNLGAANEGRANAEAAIDAYMRAYRADQAFVPAARAVLRLLMEDPTEAALRRFAAWSTEVIDGPSPLIVESYLLQALRKSAWVKDAAVSDLTPVVARYFAVAGVGLDGFEAQWSGALVALAESAPAGAQRGFSELRAIYEDPLPPMFQKRQVAEILPFLTSSEAEPAKILPRLLHTVADSKLQRGQRAQALVRYLASWTLDPIDFTAGSDAVGLLLSHGEEIDPDGSILENILEYIFGEKQDAYQRGDKVRILQMHLLIARILEERKDLQARGGLFSLEYHWDRAESVYRDLKQSNPAAVSTMPGLLVGLASYREQRGDPVGAAHYYLAASQQSHDLGQSAIAIDSYRKADALAKQHPDQGLTEGLTALSRVLGVTE